MLEYEKARQLQMQQNVARMEALLRERGRSDGRPMEDFSSIAHAFVYGVAQQATNTHSKETSTQHDNESESEYEPDQADKAGKEQDLDLDEEEVDCANKVM